MLVFLINDAHKIQTHIGLIIDNYFRKTVIQKRNYFRIILLHDIMHYIIIVSRYCNHFVM
jgi:hypothetical protein